MKAETRVEEEVIANKSEGKVTVGFPSSSLRRKRRVFGKWYWARVN